MKIKYNCRIYNSVGKPFTVLSAGTEIKVIEINKENVKIEWGRGDIVKYGFIGHKQFDACKSISIFDILMGK